MKIKFKGFYKLKIHTQKDYYADILRDCIVIGEHLRIMRFFVTHRN